MLRIRWFIRFSFLDENYFDRTVEYGNQCTILLQKSQMDA